MLVVEIRASMTLYVWPVTKIRKSERLHFLLHPQPNFSAVHCTNWKTSANIFFPIAGTGLCRLELERGVWGWTRRTRTGKLQVELIVLLLGEHLGSSTHSLSFSFSSPQPTIHSTLNPYMWLDLNLMYNLLFLMVMVSDALVRSKRKSYE